MNAPHRSRVTHPGLRVVCAGLGVTFLLLGAVGLFLPLLPTTPFVLLAAACFARASRRLDAWLHNHALLGPVIAAWREHRAMPANAKHLAYLMLAAGWAMSLALLESDTLRLALSGLYAVLALALLQVPVRTAGHEAEGCDRSGQPGL